MAENIQNQNKNVILLGGVAVIVLMFIAIIAQYGEILRQTTIHGDNTTLVATLEAANISVTFGAAGEYDFLSAATGCLMNGSVPLREVNFTVSGTAEGGVISLNSPGGGIYANYSLDNCTGITYEAETTASANADAYITGIAIFGSFMAVIVLAVIGKLIIGLFKRKED